MTEKLSEIVVMILGVIVLSCIIVAGFLLLDEQPVDSFIVALGTGSLTGLLGILAPSPRDDTPQPVNVVNRMDGPPQRVEVVASSDPQPVEIVNEAPVPVVEAEETPAQARRRNERGQFVPGGQA